MRLPVVGDPLALVRRQPIIAVGAAAAVIAGWQLLRATDTAPAEEAPAEEAPASAGGSLLGGSLASVGAPIGFPTNGELADAGAVPLPPPVPLPPTTPAPVPTTYLYATIRAGSHTRWTVAKLANGKPCARSAGMYSTQGWSAEVRESGTYPVCANTGQTRALLLVLTGTRTGWLIDRSTATIATKTR